MLALKAVKFKEAVKKQKQAEKLKSREMKEGWIKNDKGVLVTNRIMDISECRVIFKTEY